MRTTYRILVSTLIAIVILAISNMVTTAQAQEEAPLTLGIHPYLPEHDLQARFAPLAEYLSRQLNRKVIIKISRSYDSHIENAGNNHYDISYIGPASYINLTKSYPQPRLLGRLEVNGKPYFNGYIITRSDSGIDNLAQLKGKRFAFGSPNSTMSYLVPKYMLEQAGVPLESLGNYEFQGDHKNVALGVLLGEFDAGAVKEEIYFEFRDKGIKAIGKSPDISEHLFIASSNLSIDLVKKIQAILFSLSTTDDGMTVLHAIKPSVTGIVPVHNNDYNVLRQIIK